MIINHPISVLPQLHPTAGVVSSILDTTEAALSAGAIMLSFN